MSAVWPSEVQERILLACFAPERESLRTLDGLSPSAAGLALLPLLYRRLPSGNGLVAAGQMAYLTTWRQNRQRMAELAGLLGLLERAGVRAMAIKGAALILRYYRDPGVRNMRDLDVLVAAPDLAAAVALLERAGYAPWGGAPAEAILRRARVGHAWEFARGEAQRCDLHWRPLVRCFSPEVTRLFWEGAVPATLEDRAVPVPCPTDQLFHVCVHGLQWDWTPQVRWVADALTVLAEPIDWERMARLAAASSMGLRLSEALRYLQRRFAAPVPDGVPDSLARAAEPWEAREHRLMLKPCPLGLLDSLEWHRLHFRRIRSHDPEWRAAPAWTSFPRYLATFVDATGPAGLARKLLREVRGRLAPPKPVGL